MAHNTARKLEGLLAAIALLVVLAAIPVALVHFVGIPWPGRDALTEHDTTRIITCLLAIIVWLAFARFVTAVLTEFPRQYRSLQTNTATPSSSGRIADHTPQPSTGGIGWIAQRIVATILLLIPLTHPAAATAASPSGFVHLPSRPVAQVVINTPTATQRSTAAAEPTSTKTVTATARDTLYSLAEQHLGASSRWREIYDLNRQQLTSPAMLAPGMHITIPTTHMTQVPTDDTTTVTATTVEVHVERGDSYWKIARQTLTTSQPAPTEHAILEETNLLIEQNAPRLGYHDPRMMHPGDTINITNPAIPDPTAAIPAAGTETPAPLPPPPAAPIAVDPQPAVTTPTPELPARPPAPSASTVVETQEPAPSSLPVAATATPPPAGGQQSFPPPDGPALTTTPPAQTTVAPFQIELERRSPWIDLTFGSLLAAGVVTAATRLRRRRAMHLQPGTTPIPPPDAAVSVETILNRDHPTARVATLTHLLRTLSPYARHEPDPPLVRAVQLSPATIEVLFNRRATNPPLGWETVDGGSSWTHRFTETITDTTAHQLITPSLVTIGRNGDRQVLLDLDTAGSLAITGNPDAVNGVARSMLLELATQPLGQWTDILPIGVDTTATEHLDGVWPESTLQAAISHVRNTLGDTADTADTGHPTQTSVAAGRARSTVNDGRWSTVVVIVDPTQLALQNDITAAEVPGLLDELLSLTWPGSGAVTIIVGDDRPGVQERLQILDEHTAIWQSSILTIPDDGTPASETLQPPVITDAAAEDLALLLDHAANAATAPTFDDAANVPVETLEILETPEHGDDASDGYAEPDYELLLHTFGTVELETRHPELAEIGLTARLVEIVALIATHRRYPINAEVAVGLLSDHNERTAMPVESLAKRIFEIRKKLGNTSTGELFLPSTRAGRSSQGAYQLSPLLATDYELLEHRYHAAKQLTPEAAVAVLVDGLQYLRGPLLRSRKGYEWVAASGAQARIHAIVNTYIAALIDAANAAGDLVQVRVAFDTLTFTLEDPMLELPLAHRIETLAETTNNTQLRDAARGWRDRLARDINANDPLAEEAG